MDLSFGFPAAGPAIAITIDGQNAVVVTRIMLSPVSPSPSPRTKEEPQEEEKENQEEEKREAKGNKEQKGANGQSQNDRSEWKSHDVKFSLNSVYSKEDEGESILLYSLKIFSCY